MRLNRVKCIVPILSVAILAVSACQITTNPANGETPYGELLGFIPDTAPNRKAVIINDYASVRDIFNIQLAPDDLSGELGQYLRTLGNAGVASGPWISGFHGYSIPFLKHRQYLAYDYQNVDQSIMVGVERPLEAIHGYFDPEGTEKGIRSCSDCPPLLEGEHEGVAFYSWTEGLGGALRHRMSPPIFDEIGRGGQLSVQDGYVFRTLETPAMRAMIEASLDQQRSLKDVEEFQILMDGLSELRPYSVFLSTDVMTIQQRMSDHIVRSPSLGRNPLLPYEALAVGTGQEENGRYIAIVLVHANAEAAEHNVQRLMKRIEEIPRTEYDGSSAGSWSEIFSDADILEIRAKERTLLAKLYLRGRIESNEYFPHAYTWLHYVVGWGVPVTDTLLLHE